MMRILMRIVIQIDKKKKKKYQYLKKTMDVAQLFVLSPINKKSIFWTREEEEEETIRRNQLFYLKWVKLSFAFHRIFL